MYPAPGIRLLKSLNLHHECMLYFRLCQKSFSTSTISKPTTFVPKCEPPEKSDIEELQEFIHNNKKVLVLTGAGLSTESGIPDYRSEGVGLYATSDNRPVQYADFLNSSEVRRRYWARNFVAWPKFSSFSPNTSHQVLSEWERRGKVHWLVTQNVDSLHYKAGSKRLTELHGSLHRVHCLNCDSKMTRNDMQDYVISMNPTWHAQSSEMAPDGDVSLTPEQVQGFQVPPCKNCGSILKPEIVFFGANVARPVVNFVYERVDECDAVLVAGSSLHVYSGYRFVSRAHDQKKPIAIVNIGPTRADPLSSIKINSKCGDVLPYINI